MTSLLGWLVLISAGVATAGAGISEPYPPSIESASVHVHVQAGAERVHDNALEQIAGRWIEYPANFNGESSAPMLTGDNRFHDSLDVQKHENRSVCLVREVDVKIKTVSERGHCSGLFAVDQQPGYSANLALYRMVFVENLLQRPKSALAAEIRGQFDLAIYLPVLAKPFQHDSASAEPAALPGSNSAPQFSAYEFFGLADLHGFNSTALSAARGRIQSVQPIKKEVST